MRVLVGYECSGVVREAFRALGHDAWSCDILPADDGSPYHLCCDVWSIIHDGWDLGIFHPPCTYLTNSAAWAYKDGPYHMRLRPGTLVGEDRRVARKAAIEEVRRLLALPYPHAVENPVGVLSSEIRKPDQVIHPWMFGDDASKATCLWLGGLPCLTPTKVLLGGRRARRANQTANGQNRLPPSADRWKLRSKTYAGIARAMAEQWGGKAI